MASAVWLEERKSELLPVEYYHIVFTIPNLLNPIVLRNQKLIYNILFKAASKTIEQLAKDKKYLGAEVGMTAILHTWGQTLMDHPHLHCVVTGGGIARTGESWKKCRTGFFVPSKVMARLFRGKFLFYLKKSYKQEKIGFHGNIQSLATQTEFNKLLTNLYDKEWIVYAKQPFAGPKRVLEYLGKYTHRIAISNHRIIKFKEDRISFRWKDYSDNNTRKIMTLDASEFIRRFLLHVLPNGFMRIRHFGFLANRHRKKKIERCNQLIGERAKEVEPKDKKISWQELLYRLTGIDVFKCPRCLKGLMKPLARLEPEIIIEPG
jgi:hypothetical protein